MLVPICTAEEGETECWNVVEGMPGCHIWNWAKGTSMSAVSAKFDGTAVCENGKLTGEGTLTWSYMQDGESHTETMPQGPYQDGRRHGVWIEPKFFDDAIREKGERVAGRRVGRWDLLDADGKVVGGGEYVDDSKDGLWVEAKSNGRRAEGHYENGQRHGRWVLHDANGNVETGEYMSGNKDGEWTFTYARSGISVVRQYTDGELDDLRIDNPNVPHQDELDNQGSRMPGAFGIEFGTDLKQLKKLTCPDGDNDKRNCLVAFNESLKSELFFLHSSEFRLKKGLSTLGDNQVFVFPQNPPRPLLGAQSYAVEVSVFENSITYIEADVNFESESECELEHSRIDSLLQQKYSSCKDPRYGIERVGQCDVNGLIEREVVTLCSSLRELREGEVVEVGWELSLWYDMLNTLERKDIQDTWMRTGKPSVDDL